VLVAAVALLVGMALYWPRLARPEVPPSRRRLRRASLCFGVVAAVAAALGFAMVDPDVHPLPYAIIWAGGLIALFAVVVLAVLDALLTMHLHRAEFRAMRRANADGLGAEVGRLRRKRAESAPPPEGGP
jgi:membrane protein YdbS with pleckstrin-like domain